MADYEAPGFTSTVSDATPAAGRASAVTVDGGAANAGEILLNVTGPATKTATSTANGSGLEVCPVGEYTFTVTNAAGSVIATQTVTVHAATTGGGGLSQTGFDFPLAAGGALLVLLGVGAVVVAVDGTRPRCTSDLSFARTRSAESGDPGLSLSPCASGSGETGR